MRWWRERWLDVQALLGARIWKAQEVDDGLVHVHPLNDTRIHELTAACWCSPHAQLVRREGRPDGWLLTHSSADGREHGERGHDCVARGCWR